MNYQMNYQSFIKILIKNGYIMTYSRMDDEIHIKLKKDYLIYKILVKDYLIKILNKNQFIDVFDENTFKKK